MASKVATLTEDLIRQAYTNPELRPAILGKLLAARKKATTDKVAISMGKEIFYQLVDIKKLYAARKIFTNAKDEASEKLLQAVMERLIDVLEPRNRNTQMAINKLVGAVNQASDPRVLRNQVFKVADLLGIKLPHGIFANDGNQDKVADTKSSLVDRVIRTAYENPDLREPLMEALARARRKS